MFKVLLVDDEPFVTKALKVLIDWEEQGYVVCGDAKDGKDALCKIEKIKPDLVITDIRMPRLDGISLIKHCVEELNLKSKFIILSGYNEFKLALQAINYKVKDYILKPIDEDELIEKLKEIHEEIKKEKQVETLIESTNNLFTQNFVEKLIKNQQSIVEVEWLDNKLKLKENQILRYCIIKLEQRYKDEFGEEQNKINKNEILSILKSKDYFYIIKESKNKIQVILKENVKEDNTFHGRINNFLQEANEIDNLVVSIYLGGKINSLDKLKDSYEQCLKTMEYSFYKDKDSLIYYEQIKKPEMTFSLEKTLSVSTVVKAIEMGEYSEIQKELATVFKQFQSSLAPVEAVKIYINNVVIKTMKIMVELGGEVDLFSKKYSYFVYNMENFNLQEVQEKTLKFCLKSSCYIKELQQGNSMGVINEIEKYIKENYMNDISLKALSEKYYMNSVYLGQQFKRYFGVNFNDYLNELRIEEAKKQLSRTNKKIYEIAESVGYKNTDYFVSRFQKFTNMSPSKYRKMALK